MMKNPSSLGRAPDTPAERMCPMAIKFNQGETYNTLKTMGVMQKDDGRLAISQRIGKDGPDIEVDEELTFVERKDGRLWFTRPDGTRVSGHPSHFDADHAYNTARGAPADLQTKIEKARSRVERSEEQLKAATEKLAAYLQAAQGAEDGGQDMGDDASSDDDADEGIDFTSSSPDAHDARDEARELFAQG